MAQTVVVIDYAQRAEWDAALDRGTKHALPVFWLVSEERPQGAHYDKFRIGSHSRPGTDYAVELHSGRGARSTASCDCPATGICQHMALAAMRAGLYPCRPPDAPAPRPDYAAIGAKLLMDAGRGRPERRPQTFRSND